MEISLANIDAGLVKCKHYNAGAIFCANIAKYDVVIQSIRAIAGTR